MLTGDVEILADSVEVLNHAPPDMPFTINRFTRENEVLNMRNRHIALRHAHLQRNLRMRSEMTLKMRRFLCEEHG